MNDAIDIGSRLELFVDRLLVQTMHDVAYKLHSPQLTPASSRPISGGYMTVLLDGDQYRAYYRQFDPSYTGEGFDGNPGEVTCYAESRDGIEWTTPDLGICTVNGSRHNNALLHMPPFNTNFAPFRDANPAAAPQARYKAMAGTHPLSEMPGSGLHAFQSADGLHWEMMRDESVILPPEYGFDSQNVSFWSTAEQRYVCYFRTFLKQAGSHPDALRLGADRRPWTAMSAEELKTQRANWKHPVRGHFRSISRTTSEDFIHWTDPVAMAPNLPGEHLYTSQTHPYFRAPHIYIALPTRFVPEHGSCTDILFMATRAGNERYERLFTEAFIRPGLDPQRWGNRGNYAACGVVPTGPAEMSIYHELAGRRYTLRTDGFNSIHAGASSGRLTTRPVIFAGSGLTLNLSTSAAGRARVELQDSQGRPLPGRALEDCPPIYIDAIDHTVTWNDGSDVSEWARTPVRLCVELQEADLYAFRFQ